MVDTWIRQPPEFAAEEDRCSFEVLIPVCDSHILTARSITFEQQPHAFRLFWLHSHPSGPICRLPGSVFSIPTLWLRLSGLSSERLPFPWGSVCFRVRPQFPQFPQRAAPHPGGESPGLRTADMFCSVWRKDRERRTVVKYRGGMWGGGDFCWRLPSSDFHDGMVNLNSDRMTLKDVPTPSPGRQTIPDSNRLRLTTCSGPNKLYRRSDSLWPFLTGTGRPADPDLSV